MKKAIIVTRCGECFYCYLLKIEDGVFQGKCDYNVKNPIPIKNPKRIPPWCPLPDYKEVEE